MAAYDAEDGRKTESSAGDLRREERVEDPGLGGGVHADAGIGDLQRRVPTRLQRAVRVGVAEVLPSRVQLVDPDRDRAASVPDCVSAVDDEVHQYLPELGGISVHDDGSIR